MFSLKIVISFALIAYVAAYRKGSYYNSRFDRNVRYHPIPVKVTHGAIRNYGFTHERSDIGYGGHEVTPDYGLQDQGLEVDGSDDSHLYEVQEDTKGNEGIGSVVHLEPEHAGDESHGYGGHQASAGGHHTSAGGHQASAGGHQASVGGHHASAGGHQASAGGHQASVGGHHASAGGHEEVHEESFGFGGDDESDSYGHEDSHDVDYFSHPAYKYDYGVQDHKTGDHKSHWEHRDGDKVTGEYTVDEADGTKRIVTYTSDKKNGFQAIVKKIGTPHFPAYHSKEEEKHH